MIIVKSTKDSEAGIMPGQELIQAMGRFNEELIEAGIMFGGGGLRPTKFAKRVRFSDPDRQVIAGPFSPVDDQVAGYWLWEVKDLDEAVEWVKRCPNPMLVDSEIEIRPELDASDFI